MRTKCLWCNNDVERKHNLIKILTNDLLICGECESKFKIINEKFKINDINAFALYDYNEFFSSVLIQYKECYDEALKDIFLQYVYRKITYKHKGYTIVPIPSSKEKYDQRGFNHVLKMFENVKLPVCDCLEKIDNIDQKKLSLENRKKVRIRLKKDIKIPDKILLVDDVYTSGNTMKQALNLLDDKKRKIKVYVVAKVANKTY